MKLEHVLFTVVGTVEVLGAPGVESKSLAKRTPIGVPSADIRASWYNKSLTAGCGLQACDVADCIYVWDDETGCHDSVEIGGICDLTMQFDLGQTHKGVCGKAWSKQCSYTNDYYAAFMWNNNYQLSAVTVKKRGFPAGRAGQHKSCTYGMRLSDSYHGDFSCGDLLNSYRTMLDKIPYDGC
ncbi:hypothetical protein IF1G_08428 [Cordyceps javanica]|uniref:Uncharacterized protein n=1 Tax=Cordyceps javanica TaxID=43265 RepID=A0A545UUL2_9HYPO|nr:hypothetical protein IF1G_08428 [Cordyceps javanica]TQW05025.1 hypothetical protein IF2G_07668 [Cordyceps javanica]